MGATLEAWRAYARFQGVAFELTDGRNDVIAKVKAFRAHGEGLAHVPPSGDVSGGEEPHSAVDSSPQATSVAFTCASHPGLVVHNPEQRVMIQFDRGTYVTANPREISVLDRVPEVSRG